MRFKGLDLNLLVALDALLETRSVSRAAERLNLSQPAVSAALGRLRDYFRDEILVVNGKRMYPTAFAEAIHSELRACLQGLEGLVSASTVFDAATSQRLFLIIGSDYITASLLAPMIARLAVEAPGVRIEVLAPSDEASELLGAGKVDLIITPEQFLQTHHPAEVLFQERHVVVGWKSNPALKDGRISEADFLACGHVGVSFGRLRTPSFADRQMAMMGKPRRMEVISPTFATVPWLLKDTNRLALMHERLARGMAQYFPIAMAALPFPFPMMNEMVQFHSARARDDGILWLKAQLVQEARSPTAI